MPSTPPAKATQQRHPHLAKNLKWSRKTRRLGVRDLGAAASVAYSKITAWEKDKLEPSYDDLCRIAEALQVPVQYLWDHVGTPSDEPPELPRGRKSTPVHAQETSTTKA